MSRSVYKYVFGALTVALFIFVFSGFVTTPKADAAVVCSTDYKFATDVALGSSSNEVKQAQIILNLSTDTVVGYSGPGSPGNEVTYFGASTAKAIKKFQQKYSTLSQIYAPAGLLEENGNIGPATRTVFKNICAGKINITHPRVLPAPVQSSGSSGSGTSGSTALSTQTLAQAGSCSYPISRTLSAGTNSAQVANLQKILNQDPSTRVAISGPGSSGSETSYFGPATFVAVKSFQSKYASEILTPNGLSAPTGFVGNSTVTKLMSVCSSGSQLAVAPPVNPLVDPLAPPPPPPDPNNPSTNSPPIFRPITTQNVIQGAVVNVTVLAIDPDGNSVTYSQVALPTGATFDTTSHQFNWSTGQTAVGAYTAKFAASDGKASVTGTLTINISSTALPPPPPDDGSRRVTYANSWYFPSPALPNVIGWHVVWSNDPVYDIDSAKQQLNAMPAGQKALYFSNDMKFFNNPLDVNVNPTTGKTWPSIWWDNAVAGIKQKVDPFLKSLHDSGASLDYIVMDSEVIQSSWNCGNDLTNHTCGTTYAETPYAAYEADPRWPALKQRMISLGYPPGDTLENVWSYWTGSDYLIYNEAVGELEAGYIRSAIFDTARKYYPNVKMSNWEDGYHSTQYKVPEKNGHKTYNYGQGWLTGTHQSPPIYGSVGQVLGGNPPEGANSLPANTSSALKYNINYLRAAYLSSPSTPLKPWINYKTYNMTDSGSSLITGDYYQEMIFHVLLTSTDGVLYWNTNRSSADDGLVSALLSQFDEVASVAGGRPMLQPNGGLIPWDADYILSGHTTGSQTIYRYTPFVTGSGTDSVNATIVSAKNPVILKTPNAQVTISNAEIITPSKNLSSKGLWILQHDTSGSVIVAAVPHGFFGLLSQFGDVLRGGVNITHSLASVFFGFFGFFK